MYMNKGKIRVDTSQSLYDKLQIKITQSHSDDDNDDKSHVASPRPRVTNSANHRIIMPSLGGCIGY